MSLPESREEALDALITASLHLDDEEVSVEEAKAFLDHPPVLPPDKQRALDNFQPNLLGDPTEPAEVSEEEDAGAAVECRELYAAMNRKNAEGVHSSETEAELERRRREILGEVKRKPRRQGSDDA